MNLFKRIAQKIARRVRTKGTLREKMNRPYRNRQPQTAVDLWEQVFRFKETPAKRAGYYRAQKRKHQPRSKAHDTN